jgi:hypothetical protein
LSPFAGAVARKKFSSCQTLQLRNDYAPSRLITATSLKWMKWMAAAWWSGLRLLLYFVPDLRRHYVGRTTKSATEFSAATGLISR